ncbi:carotenoid cleavage dioxygenase 7, chloroplastic-like [Phragmites australis]|uniref:carotenoid cleavage dioxygenase 7, chloroplastic-like n=1 Tax=Phragmites australis TaxID=29695 RepID=UPI002D799BBD|nr:carotenoid cleavage dioxygenase 7, chloroplastic-like [Phragmites australis]
MSPHTIGTMHAVVHHHPRHHLLPPRRCSHRRRGVCDVRAAAATPTATSAAAATVTPDSPSAAFWDYNLLFRSQRAECPDPVLLRVTEGAIPPDFPAGTYYLAGPGMFSDDHGSTVHPLDGHGYLRSFRFGPNHTVHYTARYVETAAKREEHVDDASWRFTHRGPFSVLQGGSRVGNMKVMKNVANTSVLQWGGRVLCLWEGGEPYELDPRTLEPVGPFDLLGLCGGAGDAARDNSEAAAHHRRRRPWLQEAGIDVAERLLRPVLSGVFSMPAKRLLAHYKIDPRRNRLLMIACNAEDMLLPRSNFTFCEFDADFALVQKREFVLPDHLMIHDWTFTDSHYVILGNRIKLDIPGSLLALTGTHPMIAALAVDPSQQSTPVYLLPRSPVAEASGRDWSVPVEAPSQIWSMHVANAFEERNAQGGVNIQLQMSGCSYQWFNFHRMFGYDWLNKKLDPSFMNIAKGRELLPRLVQVSMDLDKKGACRGCSVRRLSDQCNKPADFPTINPNFANRRNRFVYSGAASGSRRFLPHFPFDSVVKVDVSDGSARWWSTVGRTFIGEPVFIPTGGREDDGYVLLVEYAVSDHRCHLVVLGARKIGERNALVAKLEVPTHLTFPMGFHGFWAADQ